MNKDEVVSAGQFARMAPNAGGTKFGSRSREGEVEGRVDRRRRLEEPMDEKASIECPMAWSSPWQEQEAVRQCFNARHEEMGVTMS